jgi:tetratricopeptide (TPR) repeat protein
MSCRSSSYVRASLFAALLLLPSCGQVRGRKLIQEANELYRRGKYPEAVALFQQAEAFVPDLPTLWLNKGYTCRQLIAPGGQDPESRRAAQCALEAFKRLAQVAPQDPRASELTLQTWFDVGDYPALETTFLERHRRDPNDLEAVHGLQDVYYRWGKWQPALDWSKTAAALRPDDAEAQYGVGTFVWQILSAHGGGDKAAGLTPWPAVTAHPAEAPPPLAAEGDVGRDARIALADEGIAYLHRALARRPRYVEAMTYLGLLWRQKSFALLGDPIAWQAAVDESDQWQKVANDKTGDPQRAPAPPRDGLRQAEPGSVHAPRSGKS